jgi:hypothetical protein
MSLIRLKLLMALILSALTISWALLFYEGDSRFYRLWYYTPAAFAVGPFVIDRIRPKIVGGWPFLLDVVIGTLCLLRPLTGQPPFSGHAVFSIYLLLTSSSVSTRLAALPLLVITLYAKLFLWKGDPSLVPGLLVGLGAGLSYRGLVSKR